MAGTALKSSRQTLLHSYNYIYHILMPYPRCEVIIQDQGPSDLPEGATPGGWGGVLLL